MLNVIHADNHAVWALESLLTFSDYSISKSISSMSSLAIHSVAHMTMLPI